MDAWVISTLKVDIAAFFKIKKGIKVMQGMWESLFGVLGFSVCPGHSSGVKDMETSPEKVTKLIRKTGAPMGTG